jgi:Mg-chelatase subunit ChlD
MAATLVVGGYGYLRAVSTIDAAVATEYGLVETTTIPEAPAEPLHLALAPDGTLYAADARHNSVQVFSPDGQRSQVWSHPPIGRSPGYVFVPSAVVAADAGTRVFVLWSRFSASAVFSGNLVPAGIFLDTRRSDGAIDRALRVIPDIESAESMALDPSTGDLLIAADNALHRLKMPAMIVTSRIEVSSTAGAAGRLAVLADGRLALPLLDERAVAILNPINGAREATIDLDGAAPAALAATGDELHVLVQPVAPDATSLYVFDNDGHDVAAYTAAELGAPSPPAGDWPWSITVASNALAFSTGTSHFQVQRVVAGSVDRLVGAAVRESYEASDRAEQILSAPPPAIAAATDGGLLVLDPADGRLLERSVTGDWSVAATVPVDAQDIDTSVAGFAVSTRGGSLLWFPAGTNSLGWEAPCDCDLGGRLAVSRTGIRVSRPRVHRVGVIDLVTGRQTGEHFRVPAAGLWPSDIALLDEALFTADSVAGSIDRWTDVAAPDSSLAAGLLAGPRRIAVGRTLDSRAIVAAALGDGTIEIHGLDDGNLYARFRPSHFDGTVADVTDLTIDAAGAVRVLDAHRRQVLTYAPTGPVPSPSPVPGPTATPSDRACRVEGSRLVSPAEILLGQTTAVTLTLAAQCPGASRVVGADVVLVMDRSGSMAGGSLAAAKEAGRAFVELLDVRHHRAALVSFSTGSRVDVPLTDSAAAVIDGVRNLGADGETNIEAALRLADKHLSDYGRETALPVIVLLTDGRHNVGSASPREAAAAARNRGVQLFTIGLGDEIDAGLLREMASADDRAFLAPSAEQLFPIYGEILRVVVTSLAGNLVVLEPVAGPMSAVGGSSRPPAMEAADKLLWGRSLLPASGITLTYTLQPGAAGRFSVGAGAHAEYTDGDGARRRFAFPPAEIRVIAPTPEPATKPPPVAPVWRLYLPLTYQSACVAGETRSDVALVIDTSTSMDGQPLADAKAAAAAFIEHLDLPYDQGAVVGFDAQPRIAAGLSGDRSTLLAAMASLTTGSGTRIDFALQTAAAELFFGPTRRASNKPVIVLLSDGGHAGGESAVVETARSIREAGARIYAIGLGPDADADLLRAVAEPGGYSFAPDESELEAIFSETAARLSCR